MKVTLIDYTGKGAMRFHKGTIMGTPDVWYPDDEYAIDLLIFTKSTRLTMHPGLLDEIKKWPTEKKMQELEYMANTIPSSWEFVQYTFMVEGVTRAFTHQFVRSRQFSFAQQTMRVLDVSEGPGWDYLTGPSIPSADEYWNDEFVNDDKKSDEYIRRGQHYHVTMNSISEAYKFLIKDGAKIEDARGILPTNILTNIVGSCNMRTFVELVRKRSSPRTQNEYRDVLDAMKEAVREVHPWIDLFIERTMDKAIADLQEMIGQVTAGEDWLNKATKLLDQIRAQS